MYAYVHVQEAILLRKKGTTDSVKKAADRLEEVLLELMTVADPLAQLMQAGHVAYANVAALYIEILLQLQRYQAVRVRFFAPLSC